VSDPQTRLSLSPSAAPSRLAPGAHIEEAETTVRDFLAFAVGEARYAMELSAIKKVIKLPRVAEVPLASEEILGVISVRGRVTTLFDTRRLLSLPPAESTIRSRVLLVARGEETVGLLVDGVLRVFRLSEAEIEAPEAAGAERKPYVTGIGRPGRSSAEGPGAEAEEDERAPFFQTSSLEAGSWSGEEMLILVDPAALLKG
jgi:purine-binding chemotaxis protein CheW